MSSRWSKGLGVILAAAVVTTLGACSSQPASDKQVTIEFWGASVGQEKAVALFNAAHDDVQLKYTQISEGSQGGYAKMQNAVKAGNAPCIGSISYDTVPSFASSGSLEDITDFASGSKDLYSPAAWQLSTLGGRTYGIPIDLGPMAMYYRADLFQQWGIPTPTTWDEFAAAAETVKANDPAAYMAPFPLRTDDIAAMSWQAGGQWFSSDDDAWKVSINDAPTKKVADFWQNLADKKLVVPEPAFDTSWYTSLQSGRIVSYIGAVWSGKLVEQNAPGLAGKMAIAELPQWDKGAHASGNRGGSAFTVLKGCANTKEATEAAIWLTTNDESVTSAITDAGIYPASVTGQKLPALSSGSNFFANSAERAEIFTTAANNTPDQWVYGPNQTSFSPQMNDGLKKVAAGQGTISQLLDTIEDFAVKDLKSQGLNVKE